MANFKSNKAYKKWLSYGHASGKFASTPGHQSVSVKGKKKKVEHKKGGPRKYQMAGAPGGGGSMYGSNVIPNAYNPSSASINYLQTDPAITQSLLQQKEELGTEADLSQVYADAAKRQQTTESIMPTLKSAYKSADKLGLLGTAASTGAGDLTGATAEKMAYNAPLPGIDQGLSTARQTAEVTGQVGDVAGQTAAKAGTLKAGFQAYKGARAAGDTAKTALAIGSKAAGWAGPQAVGTAASMLGKGIEKWSSDDDPTTMNVGETAGKLVKGAGYGATAAGIAGSLGAFTTAAGTVAATNIWNPVGWAAGLAALGAGAVGLVQKGKAKRQEERAERKFKRQQTKLSKGLAREEEKGITYAGYDFGKNLPTIMGSERARQKTGGVRSFHLKGKDPLGKSFQTGGMYNQLQQYQAGGALAPEGEVNLDTTTAEGLKNYRKAYQEGTLANMQMIEGEETAVFPNLKEVTVTGDRNAPATKEGSDEYLKFLAAADSGAEKIRKGEEVSVEEREAAEYLKKANPVEYRMREGDEFSDTMEGFSKSIATAPLFANTKVLGALGKGIKYEVQALKSGIGKVKKAAHWYPRVKGALQSIYHGNKLMALPGFVGAGYGYAKDLMTGDSSIKDTVNLGKTAVNFYNPFKKLPGSGAALNYLKSESKDILKAGADIYNQNYTKAGGRILSTFLPKGSLRQIAAKVGKDYIPNLGAPTPSKSQTGGTRVPGGEVVPIPGSDAVEFKGQTHAQGGILLDGNTEVENKETMDQVTMKDKGKQDYFFSSYLKRGGKSYADMHKNILKNGGSQEAIDILAKMQEKTAGRNPGNVQVAATGGPRQYQAGGWEEDVYEGQVLPEGAVSPEEQEQMLAQKELSKTFTTGEGGVFRDLDNKMNTLSERYSSLQTQSSRDGINRQGILNDLSQQMQELENRKKEWKGSGAGYVRRADEKGTTLYESMRMKEKLFPSPGENRFEEVSRYVPHNALNRGEKENVNREDEQGPQQYQTAGFYPQEEENYPSNYVMPQEAAITLPQIGINEIPYADESSQELIRDPNMGMPELNLFQKMQQQYQDYRAGASERQQKRAIKGLNRDVPIAAQIAAAGQMIPAAYSFLHKEKPVEQLTSAEKIIAPDLNRVDFNTERSRADSDYRALTKSIETTGGGPSDVIAKMAAYSKKQAANQKITTAETRTNQEIENREAALKQQAAAQNIANKMRIDSINTQVREAQRISEEDAKKEALDVGFKNIAGISSDVLSYQAAEREARAIGAYGIDERRRLRESLRGKLNEKGEPYSNAEIAQIVNQLIPLEKGKK